MENIKVSDMMVVSIARLIRDKENAFHGLGSILPMISMLLAQEIYNEDMDYLNIVGSVNPINPVLQESTVGYNLYKASRSSVSLADGFDMAARGELDVAFLSGSQIDQYGSLNSSVIGDFHKPKVKLPGGAGSAILIPLAKDVILWKPDHDKRSLVEEVDFVTGRGNVSHVVTSRCIFEMVDGRLEIKELFPFETIESVKENTSFQVNNQDYIISKPPTEEELKALDLIDPNNLRETEF